MTMTTDQRVEAGGKDVFLDGMQVRIRYGGRSHMWLPRMVARDPQFPKPFRIGQKNYWRLSELLAYEEGQRIHAT